MTVLICKVADVAENTAKSLKIEVNGSVIEAFIVKRSGNLYAYLNNCPHLGVSLNWSPDQFLSEDGSMIQCSTHHALFEIESGDCVSGPCAGQALPSLAIEIRGAEVYLKD